MTDTLIEVKDLEVNFQVRDGHVRALQGVNFTIKRGKTLGIIGESGSGKSVTAKSIMLLLAKNGTISNGEILFHHRSKHDSKSEATEIIDISKLSPDSQKIRSLRGGEIAMIFQEPMSSLTPVYTAGIHISEAVLLHYNPFQRVGKSLEKNIEKNFRVSKAEARERAIEMLDKVGLPKPRQRVDSYPHQLSGGQRQRVMIAIALSCNPSLLIADEPTTALDVTTQAQINELMIQLQDEFGMAIMYITHDLGVIAEMTRDIVVMYLGRVVEEGDVDSIFYDPKHPYTKALLRSIPKLGQKTGSRLEVIEGMVPDLLSIPPGCAFHNRCPEFMDGLCNVHVPSLVKLAEGRYAACHLYDEKFMSEVKRG